MNEIWRGKSPDIYYVGRQVYADKSDTDILVIQGLFQEYDEAYNCKIKLEEDGLFTYFIGATTYGEKVNAV